MSIQINKPPNVILLRMTRRDVYLQVNETGTGIYWIANGEQYITAAAGGPGLPGLLGPAAAHQNGFKVGGCTRSFVRVKAPK